MKGKKYIKSNIILAVSFLVPALILMAAYATLHFYPFGDKTVLIMDMRDQYAEFYASLRYALNGENSLLFSWSRSMGGNYMGLFAYYIASPLSFVTVFFSLEQLPVVLFWLTIVKTGLCGLSFSIFLEFAWNERKGRLAVVVFSCCYALMSYAVVYGMCLMWLDGLIFMPLVLLGVEKLIKGKKGLVYLLSIAGIFICNYYTAYMVGIFCAIYLVYRLWCTTSKEDWKTCILVCLKFAGNTVLAFCFSAPLLLPTIKDLAAGKLQADSYVPTNTYNFELWYLVKRLTGGVYSSITNDGLPSIFCGTLVVVFVILFFFMRNVHWKEKLGAAVILLFMTASFWIVKLDLVWHGFQYPTWFPYRYAFVFSTFMVFVAYRAYCSMEISRETVSKQAKPIVLYVLFMAMLFEGVELYNNARENIKGLDEQFGYKSMKEYRAFVKQFQPLVEAVKEKDAGFYRMEKDVEFSKNDAMLLGYNGMTHYSSTFHAGVNAFTKSLGIAQAHIWNSGYGSSPLTDSIFQVKYRMMRGIMPDLYEKVTDDGDVTVYEHTMSLPIAFASGQVDTIDLSDADTFQNQNHLFNELAQTKDVQYFVPVEYESRSDGDGWSYVFTAEDSNPVYLRMFGNSGWGSVYVNDSFVGNHFSTETNCNLFLGQFTRGEHVEISCSSDHVQKTSELIYKMDSDAFLQAYEKLQKGALNLTKQKGSTIEGTITLDAEQMIFTSIPYDEGYHVLVDGKKVDINALRLTQNGKEYKVFLTIPASAGEHKLVIKYVPPGFVMGWCLWIPALLVSLVYYFWDIIRVKIAGKGYTKIED